MKLRTKRRQTPSRVGKVSKSLPDPVLGCTESVRLERILKNLPARLRETEKRVPQMLTDYQRRRAELGALLLEVKKALAPKQLFSRYLRLRNIPRQTAYDLIADHQQPDALKREKRRAYKPAEHREERYRILMGQVKAYFSPLRKDPHFGATVERFLREITGELGFTVEVRQA